MKIVRGFVAVCGMAWLICPPSNAESFDARITIQADRPAAVIDPNIYGQFVEHLGRGVYEGIWVGPDSAIPNTRGIRNDVVAALRKIRIPLIRWPGGCFAETYHWRDAIGPRAQRPRGVNTAWGDEVETNEFGTHEFLDFVEQVGAQPFISVNVASGSPAEAQTWMQYLTAPAGSGAGQERARNGRTEPWKIPFIGIGNETWGCGGNMTAEFYSDIYRQYVSVLKPYGRLIASDANSDDYAWTETLLKPCAAPPPRRHADYTGVHQQTTADRHDLGALLHIFRKRLGKEEPCHRLHGRGLGALHGTHLEDGRDDRQTLCDSRSS